MIGPVDVQFHLNGFRPGDPLIADATVALPPPVPDRPLPHEVDVLIVGSGPTGLVLARQLARFPDISVCVAESKPGPLRLGQADGIACRTMEMFRALGIARRVKDEAYWVNETVFWKPDPVTAEHIARSGRIQDVEDGLSEFPHVILNQARVHDLLLERMQNSPSGLAPHYRRRLDNLVLPTNDNEPAIAHFARLDDHGQPVAKSTDGGESVRARYVVGCDGARSTVRRSMGKKLVGDAANQAWGVMDVLAVTDFPDIRYKCVIHSSQGSMLIIPREGGYLVRLYIELDKLGSDERVAERDISIEQLIDGGRRIFAPYSLDVKEVAWWSIYEIGQRMCDRYDDAGGESGTRLPRVFIAGDACHTHSPKAGQGMNVSMRDGFNLGWKLASVLRGRTTTPDSTRPNSNSTFNSRDGSPPGLSPATGPR
jgi:2-polyprenyl-6-methoxyphenol hydroxylase-like FAD-dependent oxidoreductase